MANRPNPLTPDYLWNDKAGRYVSASTNRFVRYQDVRNALDQVAARSQANMRALTEALQAGDLSLAEWQAAFAREIKTMHTASAAAANGGWAQMSQADWGATGAQIKRQYKFLQGFADDIASGKQPINGRMLVRSDLYGKAGRGTFEEMRRRYQELSNLMEEERRVITAVESCEDCIDYAGDGWQPIGSLPRIGDSECRTNCKCFFEYRRLNADGSYTVQEG